MNNTLKKIVVSITVLACAGLIMGPGVAQALTVEQLLTLIAGASSLEDLQADITAAEAAGGATPAISGCEIDQFDTVLKQGDSNTMVKCLQIILNTSTDTQLAASGVGSAGNETLYFGPLTKAAVIKFQEKYASEILASWGLTSGTGYVGSTTRAKLNTLLAGGAGVTLPEGCTSTEGYSSTTGVKCDSGTTEVVLPEGCTSTVGYSSTTGVKCDSGTTTPVVGAPLTVVLADDTPVGGNILSGSANNVVTKLAFTAAADADATISGLTIKSYGTANLNATDIANVKIFDGSTQIGLTQTQIQGISTFTFAPAITITKGTSKILSIVVDIAGVGSLPSATVKMGIESAAKIVGTTFAGTFPIIGSSNVIVAGGSIGNLTVTAGAPVAVNNTYVGASNVALGNFVVTAGTNEDVKVTQFRVSYGIGAGTTSTIQDTDVTNVRVQADGVTVGNPGSFSTRRATVDLTTPIILTKGTSKIFTVIGDITSGATRVIELDNAVNSVNGIGVTSGVGVTGGGAVGVTVRLGATSAIAIGAGQLSVSVSNSSPSGASAVVVRSITPQVLGVYDVRAIGEDILVNTVNLHFTALPNNNTITGSINNVGLYNETGALLSNQLTLAAEITAADQWTSTANVAGNAVETFAMNWLIPANTTAKLYVKGTTNTITAPVSSSVTVGLFNAGGNTIVATGMSSSGLVGPNNILSTSALILPALTINSTATYLAVGDATVTPINQSVLAPSSQVTLGYLKITAQNEDQTLRRLQLSSTTVGATPNDLRSIASGVAIFDGITQVTNFKTPLAAVANADCITGAGAPAAGDVCFTNADILSPVTFMNGVPKTLKVVANLLTTTGLIAPNPEGDTVYFTITVAQMENIGKTSGVVAPSPVVDFRTTGILGAGGTYNVRSNVVEITKDATSPSGNVRGTLVTQGIWDLMANGTATNVDVGRIVFTSSVGLPNVAANPATIGMFRLINLTTGQVVALAASQVNNAAGTVTFDGIVPGRLQLTRGVQTQIALQVTTTSTAVWPINTQVQWSILRPADVSIGSYGPDGAGATGVPVAATDTDFGAVIGLPTFNATVIAAGSVVKTGGAGVAFALGTDEAFIKSDAAGTISAGDTLLIPSNADLAAGRYAGHIWLAGDPGVGATGVAIPTAVAAQLMMDNVAGSAAAAFVYGTNTLYIKAAGAVATVEAGDLRGLAGNTILLGKDYNGAVGYAGTVFSLPAIANTVTLP